MFKARMRFSKTGRAKYISHLDLNRCMLRAVHKAKIPLWYTEGYNPHAFVTFALPLSLGFRGNRESMDMKIDETKITDEELLARLDAALPGDIVLFAVTEPKMKPGKIAWAEYSAFLKPENGSVEGLGNALGQLLNKTEILAEKHSKNGTVQIDIKPHLKKVEWRRQHDALALDLLLPAGGEMNINPKLLLEALEKDSQLAFFYSLERNLLYDKDMRIFE